jgi:hypothetical protein
MIEVLRRGADLPAFFSNLYLYKSEGVVREKCQGVGIILPACTSPDAATFFGFKKAFVVNICSTLLGIV